ncbi:MAG: tetratricopeptide repeat protein [Clostridiales bacterium]|nr:tetratricopeptide repeat protein [Clostridiales bacterium]
MKLFFSYILPVILFGIPIFGLQAKTDWQTDARQRKADYIFMEAQRQLAVDNADAYFELMRRAYELNPAETSVGHDLGFYLLMLGQGDKAMTDKGLKMLENHFNEHPDDYYASVLYGSMCERMGLQDRSDRVWEKLHDIFPRKSDVTMRLADVYLSHTADTVDQQRSRSLIDTLQLTEGPQLQFTARKVISFFNTNDTVAAFDEINNLVNKTPKSAESRVYAADMYMSVGDHEQALKFYNEACEVDPSSGLAYYKRAGYYKEMGDSSAYDREVFRALELHDLELDTKLEIFTGFVKEQYADTLMQPRINELFGKLVDMYPHEQSVHDLYSSYFIAVKDYRSAAEQQEYVIDTDMHNADRWRALMSLYFSARDYSKALDAGERALKLFPESQVLYLLTGEAASLDGDTIKALTLLDKSIAIDSLDLSNVSQALTAKGDIFYKNGNVDKAIEFYNEAIQKDPSNAMAMNNCAYFMALSGHDLDKAAELSRRSLAIDPDNESSLDTYAWIMFKKGDYKEAKAFIDQAFEHTDEPSAELYHHMGDIYFMCGDPDKALDYWKLAGELEPDDELLQRKIKNKTYFYK